MNAGNASQAAEIASAAGEASTVVNLPDGAPVQERRSGRDRRSGGRRASDMEGDDAYVDPLTGLCNEDAWKRFLDNEDGRCGRYGHTSCVFSIELDGPGAGNQQLIRVAGQSVRGIVKERDVVARVGVSKFAILVAECNMANSKRVLQRIRSVLDKTGVTASLGIAVRLPEKGLHYAWQEADRARHYRVP